MTTPLQTAAAAPGIDPNTLIAASPDTSPAPSPTAIADEKETFTDEWAKNPTGDAPVRTFLDPTKRAGPDGNYLSAFYDTPVQQAAPAGHQDENNAAAIGAMVNTQAAATAAAAPAGPPDRGSGVWRLGATQEDLDYAKANPGQLLGPM